MHKPKLKPPPNDKGNLAGRVFEDKVLARQHARMTHEYLGPWEKAPDKVLKAYAKELESLQAARKKAMKYKPKAKPKPKPATGPISFFKFAKGR
jgi:spore germination cell wall hydrolase CwlJ-like protein